MSAKRATVLFVDDEERIVRSLRVLFRARYDVLVTTSGREALEIVRSRPVHAVISDQRMPEMLGVELLRQVREASPSTMRLLLTGYSDLQAIVASVNEGEIFRFIEKPWQQQYLIETVEQATHIAMREFEPRPDMPEAAKPIASTSVPIGGLKLLVIDEDADTFRLARELVTERNEVRHAIDVETALAMLGEDEIAIVIAELQHRQDDIAGTLKTLKRYNPGTLTIAVSSLRDSRTLIELINQGQVYRFLPKPLSRELLRRSLRSAFDHYAQIKAAPLLLRRHVVEQSKFEPMSLSARLMDYWRRIRDNNRPQRDT
ncbi:MAG: response regulator [Rudaea sp.]|nr:response regulator [Rudaea sp.]